MAEENELLQDPFFAAESSAAPLATKQDESRLPSATGSNELLNDPFFQPEGRGMQAPSQVLSAATVQPTAQQKYAQHSLPTLYHKATTSSPTDRNLTLGETFTEAGKNLPSSAGEVVQSFVHSLTHPVETISALGQLGGGLLSKGAGAIGLQQDPKEKAKSERIVDAMWDHYKKTYFTSTDDFKRAFAKDPAGIMMDFSTLLGAGAASAPGKIGRVASRVATVTDPIQFGMATARVVGSQPARALRLAQASASNVPYSALTDIYNMARNGTPLQREGFKLGRELPETDIIHKTVAALDSAADAASAEYLSSKAGQVHAGKKPPVNNVLQTIQKAEDDLTIAGAKPHAPYIDPTTGVKIEHPYWDAYQELQGLRNKVLANDANPAYNLLEADKFKRALYERRNQLSGKAQNSVDQVAKAVRNSISDVSSEYANIMDKWQSWISTAKGIRQSGASLGLSPAAAMTKLLNSMKSDLKRKNVIDVLATQDKQIPYILAGYATKPMHKGNIGLIDAIFSGAGWYAFSHPAGAIGTLGLASPRLSSMSQTALGKAAGYGAAATSRPVTAGAYYGERALQEEGQQPSEENIGTPGMGGATPRNVRNNNPGNIMDSEFAKRQPGYAGKDANGYAVFDDPQSGLNAHKTLLTSYANEGRNTIDSIIDKWSPANAPGNTPESTRNYKKAVADALGVKETDPLDMSNPQVLEAISLAMAKFEGGVAPELARPARASGGRIMNHGAEADRLIALADKAKKMHNRSTEQLLNLPDEHVTKALAIANESI